VIGAPTRIGDDDGGFPDGLLSDGGVFGSGDAFGSSLGDMPDLDGNGTFDLVVGAERDDDGASSAGAAYVLFLDSSTPATPVVDVAKLSALTGALVVDDPGAGDFLGSSAARLGDLDGDGVEEIGLGADGDDDGVSGGGALYVVFPEIAPSCGNGQVEDFEQCDDGGTAPVDGCSAICQTEELVEIFGLAEGGTVFFTVDGVALSVTTTAGLLPAEVAALMEAEIESSAELIATGVTADISTNLLATNGDVTFVSTDDPGLSFAATPVPALGRAAFFALAGGLLVLGALALKRGR
jgi:cysteine-rich repeat protein